MQANCGGIYGASRPAVRVQSQDPLIWSAYKTLPPNCEWKVGSATPIRHMSGTRQKTGQCSEGGAAKARKALFFFALEADFVRWVKARPADRNFGSQRSSAGLHASRDSLYRTVGGEKIAANRADSTERSAAAMSSPSREHPENRLHLFNHLPKIYAVSPESGR